MVNNLETRLGAAAERGVVIVDPRQTYIGDDVALDRLSPGAVLHPGARLHGARTFLGPGAEVGVEGPATLRNAVLGERARIDAGFVEEAVLLREARVGYAGHVREGTLLEEQASTAHAVGLKQTILGSFVTLGSVINFCDVMMFGGTSRDDHAEVGSGFIHFNFTPFGKRGDKATASLVGDVVRGVFLRERRIFLGGAGGMIGPRSVGFGSVTAAGQVVRDDVPDGRLVMQPPRALDAAFEPARLERPEKRAEKNVRYIAQLAALRAWYREVRRPRVPAGDTGLAVVYDEAIRTIDAGIKERTKRLESFLKERGRPMPALLPPGWTPPPCPASITPSDPADHVAWVQQLRADDVRALTGWLQAIVDGVVARGAA